MVTVMKISRREAIGTIMIGAFGLFLGPNLAFIGQHTTQKADSTLKPCDKTEMTTSARLGLTTGESMKYTSASGKNKELGQSTTQQSNGRIVISGEPIPIEQTLTVVGTKVYKGQRCLELKQEASIANPAAKDDSPPDERKARLSATAYINENGKILYTESELVTKVGNNTSVSMSKGTELPDYSTLHYFYGYWMLALDKDFTWRCLEDEEDGTKAIESFQVTGMERIAGHDCFVVEYKEIVGDKVTLTTYWVDVKKRIARQVKLEDTTLKLEE